MIEEKVYGTHAVEEVLRAERRHVEKILLDARRRGPEMRRLVTLATRRDIPITTVASAHLRQLLGHDRHQGVVALVGPLTYYTLEQVMASRTQVTGPQTLLLLDGVTDVGNFAALIRSAVAFGVEVILLPRHRSVGLTPVVAKRSAGAVERVAVAQVANVARALAALKQAGYWIYGADGQADTAVAQVVWTQRVVLVVGAEGRGIRRLVREQCDSLVRIPIQPGVNSLNVAVAGSIVLAYIWDQHHGSVGPCAVPEASRSLL